MENCLHEAREEARTIKCAAERRAAEYEDLRLSALKVCTVFERLCGCVNDPGVTEFADSLQSLALSSSRYSRTLLFSYELFLVLNKLEHYLR